MKNTFIILLLLIFCYICLLFLTKKQIFLYRFNNKLIGRYFLSQDITNEVPGKRLFLSDGEIYLATGYLYAKGSDPTLYNFEHPPFIKYLYGFSTLIFNSPYPVQVIFGISLLVLVYLFGLKIYRSNLVSFLACLFLLIDPLFQDISSQPLLDLGQTVFALLYTISVFYFPENFIFQGILLALFAGTKFWVTPLFFVTIFTVYNLYKKKFKLKNFIFHLITALFIYSLFYLKTFIVNKGNFNIVFFILKVFKYRIQHNVSSFFGSSLILFISGYFKSWWGAKKFIRGNIWSLIWPISLFWVFFEEIKNIFKKRININQFFAFIPLFYLIFLGVQAPFPRYFLIILPFLYLSFSYSLISEVRGHFKKRSSSSLNPRLNEIKTF